MPLDTTPRLHPTRWTIEQMARQAVDDAMRAAVEREVARRQSEIDAAFAPQGPTIEALLTAVEAATGIGREHLKTPLTRHKAPARARWLLVWLCSGLRPDMSIKGIARLINRDRTCVRHALRHFEAERNYPPLDSYCAHPAVAAYVEEATKKARP